MDVIESVELPVRRVSSRYTTDMSHVGLVVFLVGRMSSSAQKGLTTLAQCSVVGTLSWIILHHA